MLNMLYVVDSGRNNVNYLKKMDMRTKRERVL